MLRENRKFHATDKIGQKTSTQNIQNLSNYNNMPYGKPITSANYHVHRHHKKNAISQSSSFDRLKQTEPKGLIFVWPQRPRFSCVKELSFLTWFTAHVLFWLHVVNIFPNGSGMGLTQPPWKYKPTLPKPQNRDYIIEPDWDSSYY